MLKEPKVLVYLMHQDDPKKCTSSKLVKFNLAKPIYSKRQISKLAIILNPFSKKLLLKYDKKYYSYGLVAIDCSWKKSLSIFSKGFKGQSRRLPLLLAANPTNYAKLSTLSSAEALAASLYIAGYEEYAVSMLSKFKWGLNFFELNKESLNDYKGAKNEEEVFEIEKSYFKKTSLELMSIILSYVKD